MAVKPALPKGTRDILPAAMRQREYIMDRIRLVFKRYGFSPIETPALERLDTLSGKYGEEGDRLIFKILPRGRKLEKALSITDQAGAAEERLEGAVEEALRYDLTVPFARFVVQNQNDLNFPFKRFQIQPVWRADRPQKGRYREFVQCDADAVGSRSLLQDIEFVAIYHEVFEQLNLPVSIRINHRQLLAGLIECFEIADHFGPFTVALDKLDKIGLEGVREDMRKSSIPESGLKGLEALVGVQGSFREQLTQLEEIIGANTTGQAAIKDLRFILEGAERMNVADRLQIDTTLARGLDYYTGSIFEVVCPQAGIGSLGGGGRYDELTAVFGMKDMPGIGISFGLDRIQLAMEELGVFPDFQREASTLLFVHFGEKEALQCLELAQALRQQGVSCEVYPDQAKLKKQLDFANRNGIQQVVLIGATEMAEQRYQLKDMQSGKQEKLSKIELLERFTQNSNNTYGRH